MAVRRLAAVGSSRKTVSSFMVLLIAALGCVFCIIQNTFELFYASFVWKNGAVPMCTSEYDTIDLSLQFCGYSTVLMAYLCLGVTWMDTVVATLALQRIDEERLTRSRLVLLGVLLVFFITITTLVFLDLFVVCVWTISCIILGTSIVPILLIQAYVVRTLGQLEGITAEATLAAEVAATTGEAGTGGLWFVQPWARIDPDALYQSVAPKTAQVWADRRLCYASCHTRASVWMLRLIKMTARRLLVAMALLCMLAVANLLAQFLLPLQPADGIVAILMQPIVLFATLEIGFFVAASHTPAMMQVTSPAQTSSRQSDDASMTIRHHEVDERTTLLPSSMPP